MEFVKITIMYNYVILIMEIVAKVLMSILKIMIAVFVTTVEYVKAYLVTYETRLTYLSINVHIHYITYKISNNKEGLGQ